MLLSSSRFAFGEVLFAPVANLTFVDSRFSSHMTASSFDPGIWPPLFISTLPFKLVKTSRCSSPIIPCFSFSKSVSDNGLVKRSVIWSLVDTGCIVIFPCSECSLKCQYLVFMYFFLGLIFGKVAIVKAPEYLVFYLRLAFCDAYPLFMHFLHQVHYWYYGPQSFTQCYELSFCST